MNNDTNCIILDATGGVGREILLTDTKDLAFPLDFVISKSYEENNSKLIMEFLASTEDLDAQGHIITGEAMKGAANDLVGRTLLYNHNLDRAIGKVLSARTEQVNGKWAIVVKAFLSSVEKELWGKVRDGTLDSFSIKALIPESGRSKVWNEGAQKYIAVITKMTLVEVSLVSIPANANARMLSWQIEKALNSYFLKGFDINKIDIGGNMNIKQETVEEIKKYLDTTSQPTEVVGKVDGEDNPEIVVKVDVSGVLQDILKESDQMKMKKKIEDLLRKIKEGTLPEAKAGMKEGEKYPETGKKKSAEETTADFMELLKNMDPELRKVFEPVSTEEEVEKAGKEISKKTEAALEKVNATLQATMSSIAALLGKTEHKADVQKIQGDFDEVKKYLEEVSGEKDKKNVETIEKLASHALALSKENTTLNNTVQGMVSKMDVILNGTPATRLEDGTIVTGADASKALEVKENPRAGDNAIDILKKSAKYQALDASERATALEEVIETIFQ